MTTKHDAQMQSMACICKASMPRVNQPAENPGQGSPGRLSPSTLGYGVALGGLGWVRLSGTGNSNQPNASLGWENCTPSCSCPISPSAVLMEPLFPGALQGGWGQGSPAQLNTALSGHGRIQGRNKSCLSLPFSVAKYEFL